MKKVFVCVLASLIFVNCYSSHTEPQISAAQTSCSEYIRHPVTSKKDREDILKMIGKYINSIENYIALFEQFDSKDLSTKVGRVEIKRKDSCNIIKLKYHKPYTAEYSIKNKDNKSIILYDEILKEATELSKKTLPFSVFLESKIDFKKLDVKSISVDHNHIYINTRFHGLDDCELEFAFSEMPIKLSKWNIHSKEYGNISVIIKEEIEVTKKEGTSKKSSKTKKKEL